MRVVVFVLVLLSTPLVAAEFTGKVVGVDDGDTIDVLHGRRPETVRLNGIDSRERGRRTVHARRSTRPGSSTERTSG